MPLSIYIIITYNLTKLQNYVSNGVFIMKKDFKKLGSDLLAICLIAITPLIKDFKDGKYDIVEDDKNDIET